MRKVKVAGITRTAICVLGLLRILNHAHHHRRAGFSQSGIIVQAQAKAFLQRYLSVRLHLLLPLSRTSYEATWYDDGTAAAPAAQFSAASGGLIRALTG